MSAKTASQESTMAYSSTSDEVLAGRWSIRNVLSTVQSMIDEVEHRVVQKQSLPDGLFQGLYQTINNIEAEILRRRAELSLVESKFEGRGAGLGDFQREVAVQLTPVAIAQEDNDLEPSLAVEQRSADSQNPNKDSQPAVADNRDILDSLQDKIKAIQSVIVLRMNDSASNKTSKTSSVVSFSILEDEMRILDSLLEQVQGASEPSTDQSGDVPEQSLMALPSQLNALFNMEFREVAEEGSIIDETVMMDMMVENQKRTNVLQHIEAVANKVKEVIRNTQDDARSVQETI